MKKHISFPSIEQFRNVVTTVNRSANFVGLDSDKQPIYDPLKPKPTLTFKGTIKLHGTNAGVAYNVVDGLWVQSRENIITVEKDNAGFAFFVESRKDVFIKLAEDIAKKNNIRLDMNGTTIVIYGEWSGKGIQKNVAISEIDKSFFIFAVKVANPYQEDFKNYWIKSQGYRSLEDRIFNIEDYPIYDVEIDFNNPQLKQNYLIELTEAVEKECPVAKAFGFSGIGEGLVFTTTFQDEVLRFKSKGEKHSASKVKVLNAVDVEKLNSINEFVEYAVTQNRFDQALEKIFPNGENVVVEKIGDVIRWLVNDIAKEETDTLLKNNLEPKDVNKKISEKVKNMFFEKINKI
jgi:hypothetical protein